MAGLSLKLARYERILVNGALIENGARKTELRILSKDAVVLRERLLLPPDTTDGALGRAALLAQGAVLGLIERDTALLRLRRDLAELIAAPPSPSLTPLLLKALEHVERARPRPAFMLLRKALRDSDCPREAPPD